MTTSCDDNIDDNRLGKAEWEDDVLAENEIDRYYGPDGEEKVHWLIIQDVTIESGWIQSDTTRNLSKME